MVYVGKGKLGDHGLPALVLYMTGLAAAGGQAAVESLGRGPLLGYLLVTFLAAGIGNAMNRGMTVTALLLKVGMRRKPTQRSSIRV